MDAEKENLKNTKPCPYDPNINCVQYPDDDNCNCNPCDECECKIHNDKKLNPTNTRKDRKMKTKTKKAKKVKRTNINKEVLIEQITVMLHNSTNQKELFDVSNIILGTHFSPRKHRLISRL